MNIFEKLLKLIGKNYWKLSNHELELTASKHKIGEYAYSGKISRKRIIEQLVFKDKFINSFVAILISIVALIISIIS